MSKTYTAIILAGGNSTRFANKNKLLTKINEKCIIEYSINTFLSDLECNQIILVINKQYEQEYKHICQNKKIEIVIGGNSRSESSYLGLLHCTNEYVLIHDGARPFLNLTLVNSITDELFNNNYDAIIPVVNIYDSLIKLDINNNIDYVNRNDYKIIQTPQAFKTKLILEAYKHLNKDFNDDFSLLKNFNKNIKYKLVNGDKQNIKITTIDDLK